MIRLRSTTTGAVVVVADEKVSRLGREWEVVSDPPPAAEPARPAPVSRRRAVKMTNE